MPLILYDTLRKKDVPFEPIDPKNVTMYTCGPTVYGRPHIGNYSAFLMADLLRRWLEAGHGYTVKHVKNITDVGHLVADGDEGEDKVEAQAKRENADPLAVARKYEEQYLEDERALHFLEPFARPRATEFIPQMIVIIKKLLEDGKAYHTEDGIYFSVETFPEYGKLSGNTLDKLAAGARVTVKEEKKHPADFALWKKCVGSNSRHLLRWNFETGERVQGSDEDPAAGFPGWHIECSAMSMALLGDTIDLHTGGEDNIFPHHECEIAQSESLGSGKPFVRYWLHRRRIDIGEQKMSKSLGNVLSVPDILDKGYSAQDLRYYLLSVHYRTNLKFSEKGLEDARKARRKIVEWMKESGEWGAGSWERFAGSDEREVQKFHGRFVTAMDDDLNVSSALAAVFDCMAWSRAQEAWTEESHAALHAFILLVRHTFGCFEPEEESEIPDAVQLLLEERAQARARKDFAASDRLRDEIRALGYDVKDTEEGQKVVGSG